MTSSVTASRITHFDPDAFRTFRFLSRGLSGGGKVQLRYGLDELEFEETFEIHRSLPSAANHETVEGLLDLLHWVAGVSYFKAAIPPQLSFEGALPGPATEALIHALYGEGLGEFAVVNNLPGLPTPEFRYPTGSAGASGSRTRGPQSFDGVAPTRRRLQGVLVPVGGGKDSAVAIEVARASGLATTLFSVGEATPIVETARVAALDRLSVSRQVDPLLIEANAAGAFNGHVPVTAIVSVVALLTATLNGLDAVAMANERSASAGNLSWHGTEVNHQFSKSRRAERLLRAAVAEIPGAPQIFSVLRPASELQIAKAFARFERYHPVFTSCNRVFRIDPERRTASWCGDCDKCRFVYLILAPFLDPPQLERIFGDDLLADPAQYDGFALLTATGGDKPFECVGEVDECLAAIRMLSQLPAWQRHPVVTRLADEVLTLRPVSDADLARHFTLSEDHDVPDELIGALHAVLGT